jgi:hypothetical protein
MNEQQRAVVQQALEALESCDFVYTYGNGGYQQFDRLAVDKAIPALRQLLEQPEPVPLTDEQADLLINGRGEHGDDDYVEPTGDGFGLTDEDLVRLIRRVEAHHGIGVKP